jgi:hypothetical protein
MSKSYSVSSPGSTGRPSIPEAVVLNLDASRILDAPPEPVIGRAFARPVGRA